LHQHPVEKLPFLRGWLGEQKILGKWKLDLWRQRLQTGQIGGQFPHIRLQIPSDIFLQQSQLNVQLEEMSAFRILAGQQRRPYSPVFS
jgi:hypothetical protein